MRHVEFTWNSQDGICLYAQGWIPENPPRAVVCLVHGLGEHTGRYSHVGRELTGAGYALIGLDLRGHGKSGGQRGHAPGFDTLFDDFDCLLTESAARVPGQPIFLYGHSLGGNLVLNYALRRHPQAAGVIASSPALKTTQSVPSWKIWAGKFLSNRAPSFTLSNGLDRSGLSRDAAVIKAYCDDPLVHDRVSARLGTDLLESGEWALSHAEEFRLPLLLVHGSQDRIVSADATHQFAGKVRGDCTFQLWEGLYHETHNEPEKEETIRFMIRWLDRHNL